MLLDSVGKIEVADLFDGLSDMILQYFMQHVAKGGVSEYEATHIALVLKLHFQEKPGGRLLMEYRTSENTNLPD